MNLGPDSQTKATAYLERAMFSNEDIASRFLVGVSPLGPACVKKVSNRSPYVTLKVDHFGRMGPV